MGFEILADTQIILKKNPKTIYYDKVSAFFSPLSLSSLNTRSGINVLLFADQLV